MGTFTHAQTPFSSFKLVKTEFCHASRDGSPAKSDCLSDRDQCSYGTKMKGACDDGRMADHGARVGSTADF